MRISFVLGHELPFPPIQGGGVNSLLNDLSKAFAKLGHEVTAYSPLAHSGPSLEVRDGVRHIRVRGANRRSNNLVNTSVGLPYALRVLRAVEPCDVLSCHLLHGFLFTRFSRARVVTHTIHRDPKRFLLLFSFLDRIYAGSDDVTAQAKHILPSLASKCRTIYNSVDFSGYPSPMKSLSKNYISFIYVGRFSADKGLESFVTAFCDAAVRHSGIRFKTIGPMDAQSGADEALVSRMRAYVKGRGLTDRIKFSEPIYDRELLDKEICDADVVVLPSIRGETLNMSILECMRLGRAVLISDLPANLPLIANGETGLLATAGDAADWTGRILEIASNPERIDRFGAKAYSFCKENFSCEKIALDYLMDFEAMLAKKPG
jgi:glycosyltransferase involved in cell wall biosynthesis